MQSWRKAYGAIKDTTTVSIANLNSDFKVCLRSGIFPPDFPGFFPTYVWAVPSNPSLQWCAAAREHARICWF